jgi:hypothetical protein
MKVQGGRYGRIEELTGHFEKRGGTDRTDVTE